MLGLPKQAGQRKPGFTSKISQVGLPYHPGQLNMLGNRTHCKQNGQQRKGSGSYFDSAVVVASYSCLSVPWSFAVLPSHF